ncbi:MAG: helix-turn-helix domain-containing protein [Clostridiales bacterium]|nr:helix-turn-helix domain-containing protein [Clostridiales bacterium]
MIEGGKREPSEMVIRAICQIFGISRTWLETGEGEMRIVPDSNDEIVGEALADIKVIIRGIAKTPGGWDKTREFLAAIQKESPEGLISPEKFLYYLIAFYLNEVIPISCCFTYSK